MREASRRTPPLMPSEARRRLLLAPITIQVHGRTYPTAGCHVREVWLENGGRVSTITPEDEELLFGRDRQ